MAPIALELVGLPFLSQSKGIERTDTWTGGEILYSHSYIHVMLSLSNIAGKRMEKPTYPLPTNVATAAALFLQQHLLTDRLESQ